MVGACSLKIDSHREFESYMARTYRQAYNMAYRMTGNRDDAEDLVQEAHLRAFQFFHKYNRAMPFENWFFRIMSNLQVDGFRKLKCRPKPLSLDAPLKGEDLFLELSDDSGNPERRLFQEVFDESIELGLARMPLVFRTAVLLCDVEDRSYEDIARITGVSIGTVRSRIHRGRKMLRGYVQCHQSRGILQVSQ